MLKSATSTGRLWSGSSCGGLAEVVLPEVDDQEIVLPAVGQPGGVVQAAWLRVPRPIICSSLMRDCTGRMKTRLTASGTLTPVSSMSTEIAMRGKLSFLNVSISVPL